LTQLPPFPPPPPSLDCDVAIIGGGFTGLASALRILERRPGARVVVLEAGRVGDGASGRNTGLLGPGVGQSLAALVRRLGEARAIALYRATLDAVAEVAALGIDCELHLGGQLVIGARHEAQATLMERLGLSCARVDSPFGPALRLPVAGTLHPGKLLAGLVSCVRELGGEIYEQARVRALGDHRAQLDGGEVRAGTLVVATAGFTPALGRFRGRLLPVHLQVLVTEPVRAWPGREGVVEARRLFSYFRLTADDRLVFGGGAPRYRWGGRVDADGTHALRRLARALHARFPDAKIAGGWTGVIGYTIDALPAIGRVGDVVHALGWCGHGVALSIAAGRQVAELVCDGAPSAPLPWHRVAPPRVPTELARWLGFRAAVTTMALQDFWS
jgi:gamma-glutamylputrescine oxidase